MKNVNKILLGLCVALIFTSCYYGFKSKYLASDLLKSRGIVQRAKIMRVDNTRVIMDFDGSMHSYDIEPREVKGN
jgi:hypothetical protein